MGYYTQYTGEIRIEPPLTWSEIKDSKWLPDAARNADLDVKLKVDEETVETKEGTLVRRSASAVVPATDDSFKGYDIVEHVQAVIDAHPGHAFTGRFRCEGEEAGDVWRLEVQNGRAVKVQPRIVWPDGAEES